MGVGHLYCLDSPKRGWLFGLDAPSTSRLSGSTRILHTLHACKSGTGSSNPASSWGVESQKKATGMTLCSCRNSFWATTEAYIVINITCLSNRRSKTASGIPPEAVCRPWPCIAYMHVAYHHPPRSVWGARARPTRSVNGTWNFLDRTPDRHEHTCRSGVLRYLTFRSKRE